ncbi:MAG: PEP-CTERM sorting domain-containing protein [Roseibacillus sp.]|nr:PEP-CTERM sorting domain-containing protein [Roseibacillus sp.]
MKIHNSLKPIIAIVGLASFTTSAGATTVFNEDFESYALGNSDGQGGWVDFGGSRIVDIVDSHASGGSQSIAFSTNPGYGGDSTLDLADPITTGQLAFSFDLYQPAAFDGTAEIYMSRLATLSGGFQTGLHLVGNGGTGEFQAAAGATTALLTDQWVAVTVSIDLDADTAAVSYGGTEIYNGTWVNGGASPSQYQGLNIWASNGANAENFYIDNLKLDIVPEPSGLALLGLSFIGLVLRRRR